jgi:thioredoxin 1
MESVVSFRRNAVILIALLPLTSVFAGCMTASRPLGKIPLGVAYPVPMAQDASAARTDEPAETSSSTNSAETRNQQQAEFASFVPKRSGHGSARSASPPKPRGEATATAPQSRTYGKVEHVSTGSFEKDVLKADVPVLVDFYADWCGPCRRLAPVLDEVARETPKAKVVKVNIDKSPKLAAKYGVRSIPTVLVFKDGSVAAKRTGMTDQRTLQRMLDL